MSSGESLLELARRYIEFFNNPTGTPEELSEFLSPDISWQEKPNKFAPAGRITPYETMLKNFKLGQQVISPQTYIIDNMVVQGDSVALQLSWQGFAVQALGPFPAGARITCQIASFLKFRDGKVVSQVDYPCYPPLPEAGNA